MSQSDDLDIICHPSIRCIKKLQECGGDVGVALEQLLADFLQIDLDGGAEGESEDTATAAEEMKNDEKMALGRVLQSQSVNYNSTS